MPAVFSREGVKVKDIQLPPVLHRTTTLHSLSAPSPYSPHASAVRNKPGAGRMKSREYIGVRESPRTPHD